MTALLAACTAQTPWPDAVAIGVMCICVAVVAVAYLKYRR